MSVPPINIADAVANPRLRDESSIMVNVGELRKLVDLAEYGIEQRALAELVDRETDHVKALRSLLAESDRLMAEQAQRKPEAPPAPQMERYAEYDGDGVAD